MNESKMRYVSKNVEHKHIPQNSKKGIYMSTLSMETTQSISKLDKILNLVIEYLIVCVITIFGFIFAKNSAFEQRGYMAFGGEFLVLAFPLLYWNIKTTIVDLVSEIKSHGN